MRRLEIPIGVRFGRLTVVGEGEPHVEPSWQAKRMMECDCDCGGEVTVSLSHLRVGYTQSCGCYKSQRTEERNLTHGQAAHGKQSPTYRLWTGIKERAVTGSSADSKRYIGRGITMYKPWVHSFPLFDSWINENLGPRPKGQSLDRVDNNGHYEPGNLQWAPPKVQNNNKRNNVLVTFNGETHTIAQWAEKLEINYGTLQHRLTQLHWPPERALTTPVRRRNSAN